MGEQVAARFIWGCSSVGRAPALQAGGHEFESHHLHASNEQCVSTQETPRQACLKVVAVGVKHSAKRRENATSLR